MKGMKHLTYGHSIDRKGHFSSHQPLPIHPAEVFQTLNLSTVQAKKGHHDQIRS